MKNSFSVTSNVSLVVHSTYKVDHYSKSFPSAGSEYNLSLDLSRPGTLDLKSTVSPKMLVIDMMSLKNWKCT